MPAKCLSIYNLVIRVMAKGYGYGCSVLFTLIRRPLPFFTAVVDNRRNAVAVI